MNITKTPIDGLIILEPKIFQDSRGYFFEAFNKIALRGQVKEDFVQDNQSSSTYGTIRGLHTQRAPHSQAKLVRVVSGVVLDVALDLRPTSKTFGEHYSIILSGENQKQLMIPRGFAHGFSVLSEQAVFLYKCDNYYNQDSEDGIIYNDEELNIDWMIPEKDRIISEKDLQLQSFSKYKKRISRL